MSMKYIRKYYGVPAKRGGRIEFTNCDGVPRLGTIVAARDAQLCVRFDKQSHVAYDRRRPLRLHPTWNVRYLSAKDLPQGDTL